MAAPDGRRIVSRGRVAYAAACAVWWLTGLMDARAATIDRTGRFAIQWWTTDDGLPEGPLRGIAFAADGTLVCAGSRQIVRFDGVSFQSLPEALVDRLRSRIGDFWALAVDGSGSLWVRGVKAIARVDTAAPDAAVAVIELPAAGVTSMTFHPDGRPILIGEGLVLGCEADRAVAVPTVLDGDRRWRYGGVDPGTGDLWLWGDIGGVRRLYQGRLPVRAGEPIVVREVQGSVSSGVITVGFGASGPLALLPDAVARRRGDGWERMPPTLPDADYRGSGKVAEASDGTVWISSHNGLLACRAGGIETAIEGLPGFSSFTFQLVADRAGGVWAACAGGLLAVRRTTLQVTHLADCRATYERPDGSLLVATPEAVMVVPPDPAGDEVRRIATLPKEAIPTAVCEDDRGRIWLGTQDSFLLRIDDGQVTQVTKPDRHFRELRSINGIVRDAGGRIWIGTANGLAVHDAATDTMKNVSRHDAPFQAVVVGLAPDNDGGVLAATLGSGLEHHGTDGRVTRVIAASQLPGRRAIVMKRDAEGTLWVGGDRGLVRVDRDGSIARLSTSTGLAGDAIRQIEEDGQDRLWIASREGQLQGMRLSDLAALASGRVRMVRGVVLGPLDGLGENECVGHAVRDGTGPAFVIPLSTGLVRFDATAVADRRTGATVAPPHVEHHGPPGTTFRFASPGVHWASPPLYQTRLVGVDADWSAPTTACERDYASLPPGTHHFHARTVSGETDHDFPTTTLAVVIPVPWYRTGWALATLAVVVGGLAAFVSREMTRRRSRRRILLLERQQEMARERARIARDLHDSLGAGLTRVALMSDLARKNDDLPESVRDRLDTIYRSARGLARSVDEIVWAVNPRNDTIAQFISYVVHDVEESVRAGGLTLRLDVPHDLPDDLPLPTQARHHICLAVREILQNVLRHAQATHVDFSIVVAGSTLTVIVHDDGVGFDRDQRLEADQDGLDNMQARVAEVGGRVAFASGPGAGTSVTLSVPLTHRRVAASSGIDVEQVTHGS